jgi:hypothetical protein
MAGPYKCINMIIKIDGNTVGVVEGFDIDLSYEGGVELHYGSRTGKHAKGGKRATFSLRRWFMTDDDTDLLWDLFNLELPFSLSGELQDNAGNAISNSKTTLSDCQIYRWRPRTGAAGDIVAEEASGEAVDWSSEI